MQPEDIDKLFRDQLRDHAPAPPAYLWTQLEAELQPARKRPAMWLYAAAAVVALLLVAGGSWLWPTPGAGTLEGTLATATKTPAARKDGSVAIRAPFSEKPSAAQATPSGQTPSTLPEANRAEPLVAATSPQAPATAATPAAPRPAAVARPQDDLAPSRHPVAGTTVAPRTRRQPAAPQPAPAPVYASAPTARPERPVAEARAAQALPKPEAATALVTPAPTGTIEVEVRRGLPAQALALADAPDQPQSRLVGRLLRKAGTVALREVREKVDLPVVTLNVLNHSLSTKDIQL
ncbi:hypothetical protein [Hymenobacter algoricola]|uniref:Uncharacterized protein n=1 Tax=Hymenobacter algoricola TaxID=486267 RepID=A0ABP7N930_9BACT